MTRGVYISQKTSRQLGVPSGADHPDLLFDGRQSPSGEHTDGCVLQGRAGSLVMMSIGAEQYHPLETVAADCQQLVGAAGCHATPSNDPPPQLLGDHTCS